jgi:hypothetical protein
MQRALVLASIQVATCTGWAAAISGRLALAGVAALRHSREIVWRRTLADLRNRGIKLAVPWRVMLNVICYVRFIPI